jgi:hypothetical protein
MHSAPLRALPLCCQAASLGNVYGFQMVEVAATWKTYLHGCLELKHRGIARPLCSLSLSQSDVHNQLVLAAKKKKARDKLNSL